MTVKSFFSKWFRSMRNVTHKPAAPRLGLEYLEDRWVPATLTVGHHEEYATIGAALSAASSSHRDTILVFPGTYSENVVISKSVVLEASNSKDSPTIESPSTTSAAPVVDIQPTAQKVILEGFEINGAGDANATAGVLVESGASATISQNLVTNLYDNASNSQVGNGIQVNGTADVQDNTVTSYQKVGILVDGTSANGNVQGNIVVGSGKAGSTRVTSGPNGGTTNVAQNGIQVSNGATAYVAWNLVTGNYYHHSPVGVTYATGIIVYTYTNPVTIAQNDFVGNEVGGDILGGGTNNGTTYSAPTTNVVITGNDFSNNGIVGGLFLQGTSTILVSQNVVDNNLSDGIYVLESSSVTVVGNDTSGNTNDGSNTNNLAKGQHAQGNGNGIVLDTTTDSTVEFDASAGNASNGVVLTGSSDNTIIMNVAGFNKGDGISLLNSSTDNSIISNVTRANAGSAIYMDSTSTNNTVVDNSDKHHDRHDHDDRWQNCISTFSPWNFWAQQNSCW